MNIESKLSLVTVDATETVKPELIKFFNNEKSIKRLYT